MNRKRRKINEKSLGYQVYKARKAVKLTAKELADRVGMKVMYIVDLERDKITDVPADILSRIARECGTTIADLCSLPKRTAPCDAEPGQPLHYRKAR